MDDQQFDRIAKALADPRRLSILQWISGEPGISCGEVQERAEVGQPTVSHHIKILKDAGLIDARKQGQFGVMEARGDVLELYMKELRRKLAPARKSRTARK